MPGRSHSNLFNKDTHDLFMLCIVLMCQLFPVDLLLLFIYFVCCLTFLLIPCLTFFSLDSFDFHCSLFVVQRKKIQF
jgi:hypothetical protein